MLVDRPEWRGSEEFCVSVVVSGETTAEGAGDKKGS